MKTLLYGHKGSIGRRYAAILDYLRVPWVGVDIEDKWPFLWSDIGRVIIATPTPTHFTVLAEVRSNVPVLCEKPLSVDIEECREMLKMREGMPSFVVCNYKYTLAPHLWGDAPHIEYDFFHTGHDGAFDCCQLIYLDPAAEIRKTSPFWSLKVDGHEIPYHRLEVGYVRMIMDFVEGKFGGLWTFEDGLKMTEAVRNRT